MRKYAFLFGNSFFNDMRLNELNAPENDIHALHDVLKSKEIGAFDDVDWAVNSTLGAVQTKLVKFLKNKKRDDLVVVYYTGHGLLDDENNLYLALTESNAEYPDIQSISAKWLKSKLDRCRSERQLLILDCCHSGAYIEGAKSNTETIAINTGTFDRQGYGRYVLASSSRTQFSLEAGSQSLYTKAIVEGLKKGSAALNKQWISIADLEEYLSGKFATASAPMRPESSVKEKIGQLVIAANPFFVEPIPKQMLENLTDKNTTVRLGTVTELQMLAEKTNSPTRRNDIISVLEARLDPEAANSEDSRRVASAIERALEELRNEPEHQMDSAADLLSHAHVENQREAESPAKKNKDPAAEKVPSFTFTRGSLIALGIALVMGSAGYWLWTTMDGIEIQKTIEVRNPSPVNPRETNQDKVEKAPLAEPLPQTKPPVEIAHARQIDPPWLRAAFAELSKGVSESSAARVPEIEKYFARFGSDSRQNSPWETAFVAWCIASSTDADMSSTLPNPIFSRSALMDWGNRKNVYGKGIPRGALVSGSIANKTSVFGFYIGSTWEKGQTGSYERMWIVGGDIDGKVSITSFSAKGNYSEGDVILSMDVPNPAKNNVVKPFTPSTWDTYKAAFGSNIAISQGYKSVNRFGALGRYQFAAPGLQSTGYVKNGAKTSALKDNKYWTGKNGIKSLGDWLGSPAAQDEALALLAQKNVASISKRLKAATGYNISTFDTQTEYLPLLAVAHMFGSGAVLDLLTGKKDHARKDGLRASELYREFSIRFGGTGRLPKK